MIALLNAVLSNASDYTETNKLPAKIHNLMESEGYGINPKLIFNSPNYTNSLRSYVVIENNGFDLFELTTKKKGWNVWDNSSFKYVRRNTGADPISFTRFEYDIYYPFYF